MRQYAVLYDSNIQSWSVIFQDDFEPYWYVHRSGLDERDAMHLAAAYNNPGASS